ncbi:MAG: GNAT family N-acetyltransferase [Aquincola sp.]|nr:GNAT family N-acetyltransferase [Aquincola sp.]
MLSVSVFEKTQLRSALQTDAADQINPFIAKTVDSVRTFSRTLVRPHDQRTCTRLRQRTPGRGVRRCCSAQQVVAPLVGSSAHRRFGCAGAPSQAARTFGLRVSHPRTEVGQGRWLHRGNQHRQGNFQSAYLGFYMFKGFERRGYMSWALGEIICRSWRDLKLHRLEANIQPGNAASISLVSKLGFIKEGYSPRYLKIGARWRDHERWALLAR